MKIAAPKTLDPDETPAAVSGCMSLAVVSKKASKRAEGEFMIVAQEERLLCDPKIEILKEEQKMLSPEEGRIS